LGNGAAAAFALRVLEAFYFEGKTVPEIATDYSLSERPWKGVCAVLGRHEEEVGSDTA